MRMGVGLDHSAVTALYAVGEKNQQYLLCYDQSKILCSRPLVLEQYSCVFKEK
jgi:hypothetical protein